MEEWREGGRRKRERSTYTMLITCKVPLTGQKMASNGRSVDGEGTKTVPTINSIAPSMMT